jgi:hypothetical protein
MLINALGRERFQGRSFFGGRALPGAPERDSRVSHATEGCAAFSGDKRHEAKLRRICRSPPCRAHATVQARPFCFTIEGTGRTMDTTTAGVSRLLDRAGREITDVLVIDDDGTWAHACRAVPTHPTAHTYSYPPRIRFIQSLRHSPLSGSHDNLGTGPLRLERQGLWGREGRRAGRRSVCIERLRRSQSTTHSSRSSLRG